MKRTLLSMLLAVMSYCAHAQYDMSGAYLPILSKHEFVRGCDVATKYDWSGAARAITASCETEYQKARAIYDYICENISYDTDYRIYHVDECWEQRKGVCQAYSELYYCLAKAAGLECQLVVGMKVNHAWNSVRIDGRWRLLDATWGAGWVSEDSYTKNRDHSLWWDVDPHWMVFTHFPDESRWQLLEEDAVSSSDFDRLPRISPMACFGLSGKRVKNGILSGKIKDLPQFYNNDNSFRYKVRNVPMEKNLVAGRKYVFKFKPENGVDWSVINGNDWYSDWRVDSTGVYTITVVPKNPGSLMISASKESGDGFFWTAVEYTVTRGFSFVPK